MGRAGHEVYERGRRQSVRQERVSGGVVTVAAGSIYRAKRSVFCGAPGRCGCPVDVVANATGVFLMTILGFGLYGSTVLLPIWLQTLQGYPSLQAGIAMAPRGLGSLILMPIVGLIIPKVDPRKLLAVGISIASVTLFQFSRLNSQAGYLDFFWPQIIQGCGLALLFVPLTTVTMAPIPREQRRQRGQYFQPDAEYRRQLRDCRYHHAPLPAPAVLLRRARRPCQFV